MTVANEIDNGRRARCTRTWKLDKKVKKMDRNARISKQTEPGKDNEGGFRKKAGKTETTTTERRQTDRNGERRRRRR